MLADPVMLAHREQIQVEHYQLEDQNRMCFENLCVWSRKGIPPLVIWLRFLA